MIGYQDIMQAMDGVRVKLVQITEHSAKPNAARHNQKYSTDGIIAAI